MLMNEQFRLAFVSTMMIIAILAGFVAVGITTWYFWFFTKPFRERLMKSSLVYLLCLTSGLIRRNINYIGYLLHKWFTIFVVWPYHKLTTYLSALWHKCKQLPWGTYIGYLVIFAIFCLPFFAGFMVNMSLHSILGVTAAGATIGLVIAPYIGWRFRKLGISKAIGRSALTVVGVGWISTLFIALLVGMSYD